MRSLVASFCSVFWYIPSVGVRSCVNAYSIGLALLSHVRGSALIIGDIRAITIADVDEKLFKRRHALYHRQLSTYLNEGA
jgi:hypothetical protein